MRGLISAGTFVQKRGLRRGCGISVESIDGLLRLSHLDRSRGEGFQQCLPHRGIGVIVLNGL